MFEKGRKKGVVRFSMAPHDGVARVELAGDFNDWKPQPMRKQKDGSYVANVELAPGAYEYKFLVNGEWVVDNDNDALAMNTFGTVNSVAQVG